MKAIKTSVISILAIGLLAGSTVGVAAQDEGSESGAATDAERAINADDLLDASDALAEYGEWLFAVQPRYTAADVVEAAFEDIPLDQAEAYSDEVAAEVALLGVTPEDVSFYGWSLDDEETQSAVVRIAVISVAGADPDALLQWLAESTHTPRMVETLGPAQYLSWETLEPTQIGGRSAYRVDGRRGLDTFAYFVGDTVVVFNDAAGTAPMDADAWAEAAAAFFGALPGE